MGVVPEAAGSWSSLNPAYSLCCSSLFLLNRVCLCLGSQELTPTRSSKKMEFVACSRRKLDVGSTLEAIGKPADPRPETRHRKLYKPYAPAKPLTIERTPF